MHQTFEDTCTTCGHSGCATRPSVPPSGETAAWSWSKGPALVCGSCGDRFYEGAAAGFLDRLRADGFPVSAARCEIRVPVFTCPVRRRRARRSLAVSRGRTQRRREPAREAIDGLPVGVLVVARRVGGRARGADDGAHQPADPRAIGCIAQRAREDGVAGAASRCAGRNETYDCATSGFAPGPPALSDTEKNALGAA